MIIMTCTSSSIDGLQMMQQNQIIMLVVLLILNLGDHTNGDAHGQLPAISTPNLAAWISPAALFSRPTSSVQKKTSMYHRQ